MSGFPAVSIVVINWNGLDDTRECLHSLRSVTYPACRLVVVDNGSEGGEAQALRAEFGDSVRLVESETNLGFAGGANLGISTAFEEHQPDYILLLNNDTTVHPAFLSELISAAAALPDLAAACPRTCFYHRPDVIYSTGGRVSLWRGVARAIGRNQPDRGQFEEIAERDYADGVCMLIPRAALERVGLLDEDYFSYWEETDWCLRARDLGLRCYYVPAAKIWHKAARAQSPGPRFQYLYRRNALLLVRKRGRPWHLLTALLVQAFFYAPLYFLRHPTHIRRVLAEARALLWHASNQPRRQPLVKTRTR